MYLCCLLSLFFTFGCLSMLVEFETTYGRPNFLITSLERRRPVIQRPIPEQISRIGKGLLVRMKHGPTPVSSARLFQGV